MPARGGPRAGIESDDQLVLRHGRRRRRRGRRHGVAAGGVAGGVTQGGSPNPVRTAGRVLVRHEVVDVDAPRRADLVVLAMAETGDAKGKPVTQTHVEVLNSVRLLLPDRHEDPGPHDGLGRLAADAVQQDPQDQDVLPVQVDAMERRAIHAPLELEDHGVRRQAPQLVAVGDDDGVYLSGYGLSFGWVSEPLVDQLLTQEA